MRLGFFGRGTRARQIEKMGAEIAFGAIAEQCADGGVGAKFIGQSQGANYVRAGAGADEEAEFAMEALGHLHGFEAGDFEMAIERGLAQQFGDESVGDAFDEMAAGHFASEEGLFGGFHGVDFSVWPAAFDGFAAAAQSSARAVARHKGVDRLFDLLDQFGAGVNVVILEIDGVLELARQKIAFVARGKVMGHLDAGLVTTSALEKNQVSAELADEKAAFFAGAGGHQYCDAITHGRADHRHGDAGVAAGTFQNERVGLEKAALFGVDENGFGKTVFDAAAGVQEFAFGVNGERFVFELEGHDWGVADQR